MDYVVTDAFGETVGAFGSFEQVKGFFMEKVDWLVSTALAKLESTGHLAPLQCQKRERGDGQGKAFSHRQKKRQESKYC